MYMKRLTLLTALFAATALLSCQQLSEQEQPLSSGDEIRFTSSIGDYAVKATDTAFEQGDVAGLYALEPINRTGVRLTWDGQAFVPDEKLYWGRKQTEPTTFVAWYPFDVTATAMFNPTEDFPFSVPADQSLPEQYEKADLLGAVTEAKPGDNVHLGFRHLMSRLVLDITSEIEISQITLEGLNTTCMVNVLDNNITPVPANESAAFTPLEVGNGRYMAITVPGRTMLRIVILTADKKELAFSSPDIISFESGRQVSASMTVKADESISFTSEIVPWNEGQQIQIGGGVEKEPEGYFIQTTARDIVELTYVGDGIYETVYNFADAEGNIKGFIIGSDSGQVFGGRENTPLVSETENATDSDPYYYQYPTVTYGAGSFYLRLNLATRSIFLSEFQYLGEGSMLESNVSGPFSVPAHEMPVTFYQVIDGGDVYQLRWAYVNSPYFAGGLHLSEMGVILDARNPEKVTIPMNSPVGLLYGGENILTESYNQENGWGDEASSLYGVFSDGEISFQAPRSLVVYVPGIGWYYGNKLGHTTFVLPGYERHTYYVSDMGDLNWTAITQDDGTKAINITTTLYPDNTRFVLGLFEGYFVYQSELDEAVEQAKALGEGFTEYGFDPDLTTNIELALPTAGKYRMLLYTEGADGSWYYRYLNFAYVPEGEEAPACEFTLGDPVLSDINPGSEASLTITGDINTARVLAVTAEEATKLDADEENRRNYIYSYGTYYGGNSRFLAGYPITVSGMMPDTDYVIYVLGFNAFGSEAVQTVRLRTGAASEWASLGYGTYIDRFVPGVWGIGGYSEENYYKSSVEILYDPAVEGKYRVMNPYGELWKSCTEELLAYYGLEPAEYIDFYTVSDTDGEDYIFYSDYNTGFRYPNQNEWKSDTDYTLIYHHQAYGVESPSTNVYAYRNKKIAEGVYQIAPYMQLYGTNYLLANYETQLCVLVLLPGVEFDPVAAEQQAAANPAPRKRPALGSGDDPASVKVMALSHLEPLKSLRPADIQVTVSSAPASQQPLGMPFQTER